MKIILCPDSFKDSLDSIEVCEIMTQVIRRYVPEANIIPIALSDGGEGFCECFINAVNGRFITVQVNDSSNERINAKLGIVNKTAIIEIAEACGLYKTPLTKRNPLYTTSYGVGELILAALDLDCQRIIIGLGGSATNDGGMGMLASLGAIFYENDSEITDYSGNKLSKVTRIDLTKLDPRLKNIELIVACDVNNQLLGANGATYTYGPQKGADNRALELLEHGMLNYVAQFKNQHNIDLNNIIGGGAAGGLGAAFIGVLAATMCSGIELMLAEVQFRQHLAETNLVITGEGRIDKQTVHGKVVSGVAKLCSENNVPCVVFAGSVDDQAIQPLYNLGVSAVIPVLRQVSTLSEALLQSTDNLYYALDSFIRVYNIANHTMS